MAIERSGFRAGDMIGGFRVESVTDLEEYKGEGVFVRHLATGLEAFHVFNDDEENLFAYAFMTPPSDSTGVAHILEHSVLCGSRNYPLKDPFLVLAKQSVKTFLNAMTFPDKTVYPASSMVEADYFNLMRVYGDAVFFPLLEEWVFRQEGHRFEIGPDGKVSIQGVVFNEMKGNYSSFDNIAGDWTLLSILDGTCYGHDSGGDPASIPDLTYADFKAFHERYYHPSNCRVFLCGNIRTERQLALLEERFLSRFSEARVPSPIPDVAFRGAPVTLAVPAPASAGQDPDLTTVTVNWLLPKASDTAAFMKATLLSELLLGHDGAPLSRALLESGIGEDIAPSSGLETEVSNLCFSVGLRGVRSGRAEEVERLVLETLERVARDGFDAKELETAIRSIDFSNREVRRSGGPFSLTMMRRSLRGWIHGAGPVATLRQARAFEAVKSRLASDPGLISSLVDRWLVSNAHRSLVTVFPDPEYEARTDARVAERVRAFEETLDADKRARFLAAQEELHARQREQDGPELLARIPHLARSDLPLAAEAYHSRVTAIGGVPRIEHEEPTNGIAYVDVAIPVDVLPPEEYPLLPFFASALLGVGVGDSDWAETSARAANLTGGLGSLLFTSSAVAGSVPADGLGSVGLGRDYLVIRVKMLSELAAEAIDLVFDYVERANFSDLKRVVDLLSEYRNDLDSSLAPAGNQYAISRASAGTSRSKAIDEVWNGISQIAYVRSLSESVEGEGGAERLSRSLESLRQRLRSAGMVINATGTDDILKVVSRALETRLSGYTAPLATRPECRTAEPFRSLANAAFKDAALGEGGRTLVSASLQVGFAAAILPASAYGSAGHPAEAVLGHWLSSGMLWERIRTTGGAYGAYSYPDSLESTFVFSTYRDPSPCSSLAVFRQALEDAAREGIAPDALDRIVTGCYSREIQPRSPSDRGFTSFIRLLYGITDEVRLGKISGIVGVESDRIREAAERLLSSWPAVRETVLAGKKALKGGKADVCSGKLAEITL